MARSDRVIRLFVGVGVLAVLTRWLPPGGIWLTALVWLAGEWVHAWQDPTQGSSHASLVAGGIGILTLLLSGFQVSRVHTYYWCVACRSGYDATEWFILKDRFHATQGPVEESSVRQDLFPSAHRHQFALTGGHTAYCPMGLVKSTIACSWSNRATELAMALEGDALLRRLCRSRMDRRALDHLTLALLMSHDSSESETARAIEERGQALLAELQREAGAGR